MKKIFNKLLLIGMISFLFHACKKDETRTILVTGNAPALTASAATLVLTAANAADTVEVFSWSGSQYGYSAAVKYTLQIAKAGTNFASPREVSMGNRLVQKYTGADLNLLSIIIGLPVGSAGQLDIRVKSSISDSITSLISNKVTITVTPYLVIINYPSLWVAGDYQGWDPGSAPKIASKNYNTVYEGYVNIPAGGTFQFKITSQADWNGTNYGWAASTVNGNIVNGTMSSAGSAGNLFFPSAGYYLVKADLTPHPAAVPPDVGTWSVKRTTWAIIGDAPTASNNWANDVPMTYDAVNKVWTVTTNCNVGNFKFRANSDWSDGTNNFGDTDADLSLDYNGANITVGTAGMRTIKLDLHVAGNYTYTIQ